ISFTLLKKRCTGIGTALAYGIGHGGIEAVLLAGLAMVNSIITSVMINAGQIETITGVLSGELLEQANIQIAALASSAPYLFLVGGIERLFALGVQTALSVIVFYAVHGKNKKWLFPLAILIHAVIDIPAAALQVGLIQNILLVEALVGVSAVLLVLAAKSVHEKNK
ncbi:MAG: YhfC family intramembrane metalloprotease, partial [Treponema sp.]|nr:YhfC family intramembrane metalloprotease [Treponema sp.]